VSWLCSALSPARSGAASSIGMGGPPAGENREGDERLVSRKN
jgi:hypothetical protein